MQLTIDGKKAGPALPRRHLAGAVRPGQNGRVGWRALAYAAAFLAFLSLAAALWLHPDWQRRELPDWRLLAAGADAAAAKGDLYAARHLYVDAARAASYGEDWEGLLASACGMKKLDGPARAYANTHSILVRAMEVAETGRSRSGLAAVARAFSALGEPETAAMILSRARPEWLQEAPAAAGPGAADCWKDRTPASSDE